MMELKRALAGGVSAVMAVAMAPGAMAHTSYLLPNAFSITRGDVITLECSFTEDFFRPEIPVESQDFHVIRPDGRRDTYDNLVTLRQMTVLESDISEPGTYRFTTGERLGRTSTMVRENGEWRDVERGKALTEGAETVRSQTATVAEVYVTKGAPTRTAVDAPAGRLAIRPITHPSEIYLDGPFEFTLTFDGKPLPNQEMTLNRAGGTYEEPHYERPVHTDEQGRVSLTFDQPGMYLVMTRHRAEAPAGSDTDIRSYTTALTFEVSR